MLHPRRPLCLPVITQSRRSWVTVTRMGTTGAHGSQPIGAVTASSADGLVHATVDASGTLTGLEFAPDTFHRSDPNGLANLVLDTVLQASGQLAAEPPPGSLPAPKPARRHKRVSDAGAAWQEPARNR